MDPSPPSGPRARSDEEPTSDAAPDSPAGPRGGSGPALTAPLPDRVGGYVIRRIIASGGMGTVFEAVQDNPRRTVALKLMRSGLASRSALRRFEYEAQILARLRHPGIAQIYEAGAHTDPLTGVAVPYFAMEYVPAARTIIQFAQERRLDPRARLALFSLVCDAVHHGHQKGIIHRDLKPSNILVDPAGHPKIIDFGVAKATDSDLALTTLQTDVGQLVGTVQYMSPEQVEADPHDLDVRSDVYSLGVVLYELLAGRPPYDLADTPVARATRIIREQPPTRLASVDRTLGGDIETITLKALEKDRERRYQSALDLRHDIERYLRGEPIAARPPSFAYQLRVLARRHRSLLVSAAAVLLSLITATALSARWAITALRARDEARLQAAKADAVTDFLRDTLAAADPNEGGGGDVTMRDVLDRAAARIPGAFDGKPEVEAAVRLAIGVAYRGLGLYDQALPHLRESLTLRQAALGPDHPDVAESLRCLGAALRGAGRAAEAVELLERATQIALATSDPESLLVAEHLNDLGLACHDAGDHARARDLLERSFAMHERLLGPDDVRITTPMQNLAKLLEDLGETAAAEDLHRRALDLRRRRLGPAHPQIANSLNNLGLLLQSSGRFTEAEPLLRESLEMRRTLYGDSNIIVVRAMNNLALLLRRKGDFDEAEKLYQEALADAGPWRDKGHVIVASTLNGLGGLLRIQKRYEEAEPLHREALAMLQRLRGPRHPDVAGTLNDLGILYRAWGRPDDAEACYRESLAIRREAFPRGHPSLATSLNNLGTLMRTRGNLEEAEKLYRESLEMTRATSEPGDPSIAGTVINLAGVMEARGDTEAAAAVLREAIEFHSTRAGDAGEPAGRLRLRLGILLMRADRHAEAEPILREAVQRHTLVSGPASPRAAETRTQLGICLTRLGRHAEAEPELLAAHTALGPPPGGQLPELRREAFEECRKALADLYSAWGRPDEAAKYQPDP